MKTIKPYLFFNGNCRAAMNFYKECLAGEIGIMETYGNSPIDFPDHLKDRIFNSELVAENVRIMASDKLQNIDFNAEPRFSMSLSVKDAEEIKRLSESLSKGGRITMSLKNGFCMLTDQFGIQWMISIG